MAGEDGAAVRETISTKARTISARIGADAEQAAQRATAQMGLPAVAMAAGFLVFLCTPPSRPPVRLLSPPDPT